jgi:C_GCAxxG_C_C family probable redox protein
VLASFAGDYGMDRDTALKVAGAFGGGFGRLGHTCGAITGGMMAIGLRHGKTRPEDDPDREKTYTLSREFIEKFKERHETTLCRELIGCDISTPEGIQAARDRQLFTALCPKYVRTAVELLEELLQETR